MELKHTPGPWHVVPKTPGNIETHHGMPIGTTFPVNTHYEAYLFGEDVEQKANARLMAAAPEMLEALLLWRDYAHTADSEDADDIALLTTYGCFADAAWAIIAKVEANEP